MGEQSVQSMLTRLIEEKHTFQYKRLVVPMSMRSPYWKYYGFPATADGDILTKVKIICTLCKAQLAYNKNTSNLRMHLQNKHPAQLVELVAQHPPEVRPSVKGQSAFSKMELAELAQSTEGLIESTSTPKLSSKLKRPKSHRSLENADSGFSKLGNMYITSIDGSIEIDGDLQFMSDPNISLSNLAEVEGGDGSGTFQILTPTENSESNVIYVPNPQSHNQPVVMHGKNISESLADHIILELQQPDIVEGRGFQRFIATLRSPCEIPSRSKLVDDILPAMYHQVKENEVAALQELNGEVGLSLEEWTTCNGDSFITINLHYQHKVEPHLETRVMSTAHCIESDSGIDPTEYWSAMLDQLLTEWHLDYTKVTAVVVATQRPEVLNALLSKDVTIVPCLIYILQECSKSIFSLPEVAPVLKKCRCLLGAIFCNPTATTSLRMQEPVLELEDSMTLDLPSVWMSTYQMLEQLVARRSLFASVLENIEALSADQRIQLLLTDEEWTTIEDVVAALMPFKVAVLTLGEERYPLLSLLEPLLWQLCNSHLQEKEGDSPQAVQMKQILSQELSEKYSNAESRSVLRKATMLDPRFKTLNYADKETKAEVNAALTVTLEALIRANTADTPADSGVSPAKKSRLSGMALLLGDLYENKSGLDAKERAKLELIQFNSEHDAQLDACPLQWWTTGAPKCPNLVLLARRYLCVPATATPSQRIQHTNAIQFHQRRAAIPLELVDILLFLNGNYHI